MVAAGELAALRADGARRPEETELWRDQMATLQRELRERKEMKDDKEDKELRKELQEARHLQQQLQQQEELQMRKAQEETRQAPHNTNAQGFSCAH